MGGAITPDTLTDKMISDHAATEHPIGQCWCDVALGIRSFPHTTQAEARRRVAQAINASKKTVRDLAPMITDEDKEP